MKQLRQYVRKILIEQNSKYPTIEEIPLISRLMQKASEHYLSYDGVILKFVQPENCATLLDIRLSDDSNRPDALYIEKLEVLRYPYGEVDLECFGKGYAREVLSLLTKTADDTGTELYLIAAPEFGLRRQYPSLPDKDDLANLYADYGFYETARNYAQVHMTRDPKNREQK